MPTYRFKARLHHHIVEVNAADELTARRIACHDFAILHNLVITAKEAAQMQLLENDGPMADFKSAGELRDYLKTNFWACTESGKAPNGNNLELWTHRRKARYAVIILIEDPGIDFVCFQMIPPTTNHKLLLYKLAL